MKKYFIIAVGTILVGQALYASATKNDVIASLKYSVEYVKSNFSTHLDPQKREQNIKIWQTSFRLAKNFIENNSKLLGVKDTDIITALNNLEKSNGYLIEGIIPIVLKSSLNQGTQLSQINEVITMVQKNIKETIDKFSEVKFIISHKKEAEIVIKFLGKCLQEIATEIAHSLQLRAVK